MSRPSQRVEQEELRARMRAAGMQRPDGGRMTQPDCCEVIITAPDAAWLTAFSKDLVERRLCASAQTVVTVRSVYRWKGQVHEATEARVALRTRLALLPRIVAATREVHPYEVCR